MVKVLIITIAVLVACAAASPFGGLFPGGKDILGKSGNLIGIEADVHANVAGQDVDLEADAGIGEDGIQGHGAGAANVLGQQAGADAGAGVGRHGIDGHGAGAANVLGQKAAAEGGAAAGDRGIGGHGAGAADIFGQQAGTHADVLDGYPGETYGRRDYGRQYYNERRRGY